LLNGLGSVRFERFAVHRCSHQRNITMRQSPPPSPVSGQTIPGQQGNKAPRLPHERDESADSQEGTASAQGTEEKQVRQEAYGDAAEKMPDTSLGPVTDRVYAKQKKAAS
jgi:hypothetical protein